MMAPASSISNPDASTEISRESKRKKRRKTGADQVNQSQEVTCFDQTRWRSQEEQQIYSSKLLDALRHVRRRNPSPVISGRTVRETADRVLAVSAKGRSRWSRAILLGPLSLRLNQINRKHRKAKVAAAGSRRSKKPAATKKRLSPLQSKVRVLGQLVPGCRKLSYPNLLEETTDYIAALQMQIRAMTVLNSLLNGTGTGTGLLASQPDRLGANQS